MVLSLDSDVGEVGGLLSVGPLVRVEGFATTAGNIVTFSAHEGDVILLRGANGSGKTSLLRRIAGVGSSLTSGTIEIRGQDSSGLSPQARSRLVGLVFQRSVDGLMGLTVEGESRLRNSRPSTWSRHLLPRVVTTLSSGEARRVAIGLAESKTPPILLLDEVAEGLDANARLSLLQFVDEHRSHGCVIATDHAGHLAKLVTSVIDLTPTAPSSIPDFPRGKGAVIVESIELRLELGPSRLRLPAVSFPSGVHVLAGPNGGGKTTLLRRLAGLAHSDGVTVSGASPRIGTTTRFAPADARGYFLHETVARELAGIGEDIARMFVPPELLSRHPLTLSGGEAQRVSLAKTLGRPASGYFLDEPESHLDASAREALALAACSLSRNGSCVVIATHDSSFIKRASSVTTVGGPA